MKLAPLICIVFFTIVNCIQAHEVPIETYFRPTDQLRFKHIFNEALKSKDIGAINYSVLGLKLLKENIPNQEKICDVLSQASSGSPNVETSYYAAVTSSKIGGCKNLPPTVIKSLKAVLDSPNESLQNIYYAVHGLSEAGVSLGNVPALITKLQTSMKKDDSLINMGYFFNIAALLRSEGSFAVDRIEDAIVQADEVDQKMLQFEGGLTITAFIVSGIYKLAIGLDKKVPLTDDQIIKFSNYFVSRRTVQLPKGCYNLLEVLNTLSNNKFQVPIAVSLASNTPVTSSSPNIQIHVNDLLGRPVGQVSVTAETVTRLKDNVVEAANVVLSSKLEDSTCTFNLYNHVSKSGFYRLTVSVKPVKSEPRLIGLSGVHLNVKIEGKVSLDSVEIGTADADQTSAAKLNRVTYPSKSNTVIEADWHQRFLMRFALKNVETKEPAIVHQAFIVLTSQDSAQEIIYIAEPETSKNYRFDIDLGSRASDFSYTSGRYTVSIIIGDAILSNSFHWKVADIQLTFQSKPSTPVASKDSSGHNRKAEIKHVFREPDKRPPSVISTLFTAFVCIPLLILLIMWMQIGINISKFPASLSSLGFHLSLGAMFGLLAAFWLYFNMFKTLRILLLVCGITFLCGNRMLMKISTNHQ